MRGARGGKRTTTIMEEIRRRRTRAVLPKKTQEVEWRAAAVGCQRAPRGSSVTFLKLVAAERPIVRERAK
jgi:hypothetical protein